MCIDYGVIHSSLLLLMPSRGGLLSLGRAVVYRVLRLRFDHRIAARLAPPDRFARRGQARLGFLVIYRVTDRRSGRRAADAELGTHGNRLRSFKSHPKGMSLAIHLSCLLKLIGHSESETHYRLLESSNLGAERTWSSLSANTVVLIIHGRGDQCSL